MVAYLDNVILVYYFDHTGTFPARASHRLASLRAAGDEVADGGLVRMECRIGPLGSGHCNWRCLMVSSPLPKFGSPPLSPAVFDRAADIRARYGFMTPDSVHLAA